MLVCSLLVHPQQHHDHHDHDHLHHNIVIGLQVPIRGILPLQHHHHWLGLPRRLTLGLVHHHQHHHQYQHNHHCLQRNHDHRNNHHHHDTGQETAGSQ